MVTLYLKAYLKPSLVFVELEFTYYVVLGKEYEIIKTALITNLL